MKNYLILIAALVLSSCGSDKQNERPAIIEVAKLVNKPVPEMIQFPSLDSIPVTANLYHYSTEASVIVLCHQARFNKFEYVGIAKKLMDKGFNCLAIDQRSGGGLVEEINQTMFDAKSINKPTEFLDAEQDIIAAVNFAADRYGKKVILWGSSYSSVLALYTAIASDKVKAVIAFSPGDYFEKEKGSLKTKLETFKKPMFVTSSREESKELTKMLSKMKMTPEQTQFIPDSAGFHGSRALWKTSENNEQYWKAINNFLEKLK